MRMSASGCTLLRGVGYRLFVLLSAVSQRRAQRRLRRRRGKRVWGRRRRQGGELGLAARTGCWRASAGGCRTLSVLVGCCWQHVKIVETLMACVMRVGGVARQHVVSVSGHNSSYTVISQQPPPTCLVVQIHVPALNCVDVAWFSSAVPFTITLQYSYSSV